MRPAGCGTNWPAASASRARETTGPSMMADTRHRDCDSDSACHAFYMSDLCLHVASFPPYHQTFRALDLGESGGGGRGGRVGGSTRPAAPGEMSCGGRTTSGTTR